MELIGRVEKKPFAGGTKSARHAVMLVTDGGEYVLRRKGGNAFQDEVLDGLVGKAIQATGDLHGYTFLMNGWNHDDPCR